MTAACEPQGAMAIFDSWSPQAALVDRELEQVHEQRESPASGDHPRGAWTCKPIHATVLESPSHRVLEGADRVLERHKART